jgi:hypothetical protein
VRTLFIGSTVLALLALFACGKEEWNSNQLGVTNPYTETDETEPTDEAPTSTDATTTSAPIDAGADANDARPADARADVRDATPG